MKKFFILVLTLVLSINISSVLAIPIEGVTIDDGGGDESAPIPDNEGNTFYDAKRIYMNQTVSASFSSYYDDDYFVYTAEYTGRVKIYTTGYANTKLTLQKVVGTPYGPYIYSLDTSNDIYDHTDNYSNSDIISKSRTIAYSSVNYISSNGYLTFYQEKGQAYYIKAEKESTTSDEYYSIRVREDSFCINNYTNSTYNQDTYTYLMYDGSVLYYDDFDAIDGNGRIDYFILSANTNYINQIEIAMDQWNDLKAGDIFFPINTSNNLDLIVVDTSYLEDLGQSLIDFSNELRLNSNIPLQVLLYILDPDGDLIGKVNDLGNDLKNINTDFESLGVYIPIGKILTGEILEDEIILEGFNVTEAATKIYNAIQIYNEYNQYFDFFINLPLNDISTDLSIILINHNQLSTDLEYRATAAHELGHSLGFGDMYRTNDKSLYEIFLETYYGYSFPNQYADLEGRMNIMGSSHVSEIGFCDQLIYNQLFN